MGSADCEATSGSCQQHLLAVHTKAIAVQRGAEVRLGAHSVRWREENSVEQFALQVTDVSVPGWK
jgi:hypothetical protein